jgi:hypothetical protein
VGSNFVVVDGVDEFAVLFIDLAQQVVELSRIFLLRNRANQGARLA